MLDFLKDIKEKAKLKDSIFNYENRVFSFTDLFILQPLLRLHLQEQLQVLRC